MDSGTYSLTLINQVGEESGSTTVTVVGSPSPPGGPLEIKDIHKTGAFLQWKLPEDDGGEAVEEFIVEATNLSDPNGKPVVVGKCSGDRHNLPIDGLTTGCEYDFKVYAKNKEGVSAPLNADGPVTIKTEDVPPSLDYAGMENRVIRVGETLRYDVPISGDPSPEAQWFFNEESLVQTTEKKVTSKISITTTSAKACLVLENAQRSHSGMYRLLLHNRLGEIMGVSNALVIGTPTPPVGPLLAKDIHATGATLLWNPPQDDGGVPITDYVVEAVNMSSKNKEPIEVGRTAAGATYLSVKQLETGSEYVFRVKAQNIEGISEPLISTESILIQDPDSAPSLDWVALRNVKLREGDTLSFDVPIHGVPTPTTQWLHGTKGLSSTDRLSIEFTESMHAQFTLSSVTRADSGAYSLIVKNRVGEERGTANVLVIGQPLSPEGPVEVSNVNRQGCTIGWKPPIDDGGVPLEEYVIEIRNLSDPDEDFKPFAKCPSGVTHYDVSGLPHRSEVEFRVMAKNAEGLSDPLNSSPIVIKDPDSVAFIAADSLHDITVRVGETINLSAVIGGEPPPNCEWASPNSTLSTEMNARVSITISETITEMRMDEAVRDDSGVYSLRVWNKLGEAKQTAKVLVIGPPLPPQDPFIVFNLHENGCTLQWEPPSDTGGIPLSGYVIEAQNITDGGEFVEIGTSGPDELKFTADNLVSMADYKFRVRAKNTEGVSEPLTNENVFTIKNPWDDDRRMLEGKFALVTGSGGQIGRAICKAFVRHGAVVAMVDIDKKKGELTKATLGKGNNFFFNHDVTRPAEVEKAFKEIMKAYNNRLPDIIVNGAHAASGAKALAGLSASEFDDIVGVAQTGAFLIIQAFSNPGTGTPPPPVVEGGVTIVNLGSILAKAGARVGGHAVDYGASQAGIVGLTKSVAREIGPSQNGRANAVLVGAIVEAGKASETCLGSLSMNSLIQQIPLRRIGRPSEVADTVVFLSSPLARYVTGAVIEVTGGFYM